MRSVASLVLLAACQAAGGGAATPQRPNVILIVADDLGWGDLGSYGQELVATPHLDRLAAEGRRFTRFYAGSTVCAPSRAVLMTGLHTGHCGIRGNARQDLLPEDVTLAEVMRAAGYACGAFGKWGLGHEGSDGIPTRQGFDAFFGYLDQSHAHNYYPTFLIRDGERVPLRNVVPQEGRFGQGEASEKVEYSHDLITAEALSFLERHAEEPFFLYVPWTIPHANNEAGERGMEVPELGEYAERDWPEPEKGFAGMVARMDRDVGRIVARVDELGLAEDTLILFTSDNGPHGEGGHRPDFFDSNGPLRGIKRDLTEGGIRVPLIARWPGRVPPATTADHVAAFQDFLPTLADLAGARFALPPDIDGLSFVPALLGEGDQPEHDHLYWAFYERGGARALLWGRWKAVQQPIRTPVRLYDLDADLGEEHDVAGEHPELVQELTRLMDAACTPSERWRFPERES